MSGQTLFEKLWRKHVVRKYSGGRVLLYVDRLLVYEVTSPQAFAALRRAGRKPWRSGSILATCDHGVPTTSRDSDIADPLSRLQVETLSNDCREFGITEFGLHDRRQGIVHVVGPEQGITLPGLSIVCGDSHTSTHGALGTLAFGVGTSDIEHVLATQCLVTDSMKPMVVVIDGELRRGVAAKDVILSVIGAVGSGGATGYAMEFQGPVVRNMSVEARMTLCNMAVEAGARVGLVGVDETTIRYVRGHAYAPTGAQLTSAERYWRTLVSDPGANFEWTIELDGSAIRPQVTWGTSPEMVVPVNGRVPDPAEISDAVKSGGMRRALDYMGLSPGTRILDIEVDKVFIGSCTNGRIEDLRAAAAILRGNRIDRRIKLALAVPGSGLVKSQAEAEGLHEVFLDAGFEWRNPGCSMCLGLNEDRLSPGERCASTSNRNFEGRQGYRGRSHLVSPEMAAGAAIAGQFVDISRA